MAASIQQLVLTYNAEDHEGVVDEVVDEGDGGTEDSFHFKIPGVDAEWEAGPSEASLFTHLLRSPSPHAEEEKESQHFRKDVSARPDDDMDTNEKHNRRECGSRRSGREFLSPLKPLSEPRRFWQLVVGAFCCVAVSSSYVFNLFSGRLQSKYDFTQSQMTTISTVSDLSGILILLLGAVYDHYGAQPIFLIALILLPLNGLFFGLTFADLMEGSLPAFCLYACMQSLGTSLLDVGSVMTLLSIFPANKGAVVAVMKTFSGMGSAILGAIHLAFFASNTDNDTCHFFYFLSLMTMTVCFLAVLFIEVPPYIIRGCEKNILTPAQHKERSRIRRQYLKQKAPFPRFAIGFTIVGLLTFFLPIQGALSAYMQLKNVHHVIFACIAVGLFAFYPMMALPVKTLDRNMELVHPGTFSVRSSRVTRASYVSGVSRETMDGLSLLRDLDYIPPHYHTTLMENFRTLRFWLLLWSLFAITGTQVILIGNMRFVFGALAGELLEESFIALLVVITGVGSGIGRIILSILEMVTQGKCAEERIPITFTLFIPSSLTVITLLLLIMLPKYALPLPCFTMALANGSSAAAIVIVLRTIYVSDIAKHYNICSIAGIASSLLMNRVVYGEWYTRQAKKQGSTLCYGEQCVILPLLFCLGLSASAVISVGYVHRDYRNYCQDMLLQRAQRFPKKNNSVPNPTTSDAYNSGDDNNNGAGRQ